MVSEGYASALKHNIEVFVCQNDTVFFLILGNDADVDVDDEDSADEYVNDAADLE